MTPSLGALCCLQAWEQRAPIPGGITLEPILRRIALDYSPASLARVDTFLDALRTAKKPQPDAFLLDPAGNNIEAVYHGEAERSAASVKVSFEMPPVA